MTIFKYKEYESPPEDQVYTDYQSKHLTSPIIIDNGSYQLIFRSLVGKAKSTSNPIVGNSLKESDLSRLSIKSPFDNNILVHPPSQESIFDYIFYKLGIDKNIENPIVLTEPPSNPSYCRKYTSELLFECYNVPSVVYGIDSLFSFYNNRELFKNNGKEALIIGSGHNTTHVYNVQNYKVQHYQTKRINVGGATGTDYLKKTLQLKYPNHKSYLSSLNYINQLKEQHCCFTKESFTEQLTHYQSSGPEQQQQQSDIIQLPFEEIDYEKLEEERQRKIQQRKEFGIKLKEMAEIKRKEKKQVQEDRLALLNSILEVKKSNNVQEFESLLRKESIGNERELVEEMDELNFKLFGTKKETVAKTEKEEFPLLFIADTELNADQLKEKRKQKQLKNLKDGKKAHKRKRDEEKEREEAQSKYEEECFIKDPEQYIKDLYQRRKKVLDKRDARIKLKTSKQQMVRRESRLRTITPTERLDREEELDVEEEEENRCLNQFEKLLNKFDPGWNSSNNIDLDDSNINNNNNITNSNSSNNNNNNNNYETKEDYQIVFGVERIKIPEILYQPKAIIGLDQMGLIETISSTILSQLPLDVRSLVSQNVFLTGGNVNTKYFKERIEYEIRQLNEPGTLLNIITSKQGNSSLDAWYGARKWTLDNMNQWSNVSISRQDYQEKGYDYITKHFASNLSIFD
ncbi:hypothetical protein CYY_010304 [Polysphondylium violaceum]|uniref:Actin-related protein 5 n=1 Tax=Polysphondylium violaceum TaxID=133409 RepID=A0A8J4UNT6_9MYCE|nr:hypothetical protein CYY_010304 [Polysphondylium violaceum]